MQSSKQVSTSSWQQQNTNFQKIRQYGLTTSNPKDILGPIGQTQISPTIATQVHQLAQSLDWQSEKKPTHTYSKKDLYSILSGSGPQTATKLKALQSSQEMTESILNTGFSDHALRKISENTNGISKFKQIELLNKLLINDADPVWSRLSKKQFTLPDLEKILVTARELGQSPGEAGPGCLYEFANLLDTLSNDEGTLDDMRKKDIKLTDLLVLFKSSAPSNAYMNAVGRCLMGLQHTELHPADLDAVLSISKDQYEQDFIFLTEEIKSTVYDEMNRADAIRLLGDFLYNHKFGWKPETSPPLSRLNSFTLDETEKTEMEEFLTSSRAGFSSDIFKPN